MFKSKHTKTVLGVVGAAGVGLLGYFAYLKYLETVPDYKDDILIQIQKKVLKNIFPHLSIVQRDSLGLAKKLQAAKDETVKAEVLQKYKEVEMSLQELRGSEISKVCSEQKVDLDKYLRSNNLRRDKNDELKRIILRIENLIVRALRGESLDDLSENNSELLTVLQVREVYHNATTKFCNSIIEKVDGFVKEKKEKKESFNVDEISALVKVPNVTAFSVRLVDSIKEVEGIMDREEHYLHIFNSSLERYVRDNTEGIRLFLDQCDYTKRLVIETLTSFNPDVIT